MYSLRPCQTPLFWYANVTEECQLSTMISISQLLHSQMLRNNKWWFVSPENYS